MINVLKQEGLNKKESTAFNIAELIPLTLIVKHYAYAQGTMR